MLATPAGFEPATPGLGNRCSAGNASPRTVRDSSATSAPEGCWTRSRTQGHACVRVVTRGPEGGQIGGQIRGATRADERRRLSVVGGTLLCTTRRVRPSSGLDATRGPEGAGASTRKTKGAVPDLCALRGAVPRARFQHGSVGAALGRPWCPRFEPRGSTISGDGNVREQPQGPEGVLYSCERETRVDDGRGVRGADASLCKRGAGEHSSEGDSSAQVRSALVHSDARRSPPVRRGQRCPRLGASGARGERCCWRR